MVGKLAAEQKKTEAEILGKRLSYVKVEKLVDMLAWTLGEAKAGTIGNTVDNVEAKALVQPLAVEETRHWCSVWLM